MGTLTDNGGYIGVPADVTADPYHANKVFALYGAGTNGSTQATSDVGGHSLTWTNADISTDQSKFYGSSVHLDATTATNAKVDVASLFTGAGTGDFDVGGWYWFEHLPGSGAPTIYLYGTGGNSSLELSFNSVNLQIARSGVGGDNTAAWAGYITAGTWVHIKVSRSGSTAYIFVNGVLIYSGANSTNYGTAYVGIGQFNNSSGATNVYFTDVVAYYGVCLHTSSFTPPTRSARTSARRYASGCWGV